MVIDWVSILMAVAGGLATTLVTRFVNGGTPSQPAAPNPTPAPAPAPTPAPKPSVPSHPLLDAIVSVLQGTVAANPQLAQLEGVLVTLIHPNGTVNLTLNKGAPNATATKPAQSA